MKKKILIILPYFSVIVFSLIFYIIGIQLPENLKAVFLGISGAFISIPILFIVYDQITRFSNKKINKEIFDYVRVQVDTVILSITNQLIKMIINVESQNRNLNNINVFLNLSKSSLAKEIKSENKLGFHVLKEFDINEENLHKLLSNAFIIEKLENDQIIAIIGLIKSIRELIWAQNNGLFVCLDLKVKGFKISKGTEINDRNTEFPDRYLLLKHHENNNFIVEDFGDFATYKVAQLLNYHKVRDDAQEYYIEVVYNLLHDINRWLELTNNEFIIDSKVFRLRPSKARA